MGVPTPTQAPTPFPEGDPRNGKYFEVSGALEHQLNSTLAKDNSTLSSDQASFNYSAGSLDRQLPVSMQTTRSTANTQGLLESGTLAQRAGTVEAKYAAQRGKLATTLQEDEGKVNEAENNAKETFAINQTKALQAAREEGLKGLETEGANEVPTPVNAGGVRTITGPAGPGGVLPYTEKTPGGSVHVGPSVQPVATPVTRVTEPTEGVKVRRVAAKKAVSKKGAG